MKTDVHVKSLVKRLENLLNGSSPSASKWDNGPIGPTISNWDMINQTIKANPGNSWYIPSEDRINAWTSQIGLTPGNIDLRDFELEQKFSDMRHERVVEYDRKWEEARDRGDTDYTSKHACPGLANTFHENWTTEEIKYYSDENRFPILKEGHKPMFNLNHRNWSKDKDTNREDNS
jgi:hypothetical protein